jgi:hypothetical protein
VEGLDTPLLFAVTAFIIVVVVVIALIFLRRAMARAKEIGLANDVVKKTIRVSAVFSVVPSIPIAIGLAAMVPLLGVALPWLRLSVIGSVQYELFAAQQAATVTGHAGSGLLGAEAFNTAAWIMTLSIISGPVFCIFFLKRYEAGLHKLQQKDSKWADVLVSAIFMGLVGTIGGQQIAKGGIFLTTLLVSMAIMVVCGLLVRKKNVKWLEGFALPVSMIGSLAVAFVMATAQGGA